MLALAEEMLRAGGGAWVMALLLCLPVFFALKVAISPGDGSPMLALICLGLYLLPWRWFPAGPGIFGLVVAYGAGGCGAVIFAHLGPKFLRMDVAARILIVLIVVAGILFRHSGEGNVFGLAVPTHPQVIA